MAKQEHTIPKATSISRARRWLVDYPRAVPLAIFLAIAVITGISVFAIESNARARERAEIGIYAQTIAAALERRGNSFSSYLRAGAALFSSLDQVSPQVFRQFVSEFKLETDYRGTEGIGWIAAVDPINAAQFEVRNRAAQTGFVEIRPDPDGRPEVLAPVTYFSPDSERNRRALGFDMYSEPVRAAAMAEAVRTLRPTASGRVVLAQEGGGDAAGFVLFMPVYRDNNGNRRLSGFVYSPFDAARFLDSVVDLAEPSALGLRLYDGEVAPGNLLAARSFDSPRSDQIEQNVTIANRPFLLVIEAPVSRTLAPLSMVTLLFGIAVASLLMLLARLLTKQAGEDHERLAFYEEQHSIRNLLTRELNHRVKNTLANVLSILSLTRRRTNDLDQFADGLEGRIRALSATHDLLTQSDWGTIPLSAVIEAELQHFGATSDHPIEIDGPPLELAPNDALSFGLAIHELATNAAKYGALSVVGGSVSVKWHLIEAHLAEVEWRERGGPPVTPPQGRGFGTELIEKIVAHEMRHPVQLDFEREGVRCVMCVPIRQRSEFQIRENASGHCEQD